MIRCYIITSTYIFPLVPLSPAYYWLKQNSDRT